MDKNKILELISQSVSLLPDEKYHLMVAIERGKIDSAKIASLEDILIQEQKDMGKQIISYKEECLGKVEKFEEHKYDRMDTKKMKKKIDMIKQKIKKLDISIDETKDKEEAEDMILQIK